MFRGRARDTADLVAWVLLGLVLAFLLWELHPLDLLSRGTPVISDMGGHVHEPHFLRHHLLPHGRISGWSNDWFAGYPTETFYFPVGGVLVALLSFLLPYTVALKLVAATGIVALPVSAYFFGRLASRSRLESACLSVAVLPLLLQPILLNAGGSIGATLNGEYSYMLGLSLGLLTLGFAARGLDRGGYRVQVAALFGLTVVTHAIPALFVVIGIVVMAVVAGAARGRAIWVGTTLVVGGIITAFWSLPFVLNGRYVSGAPFQKAAPIASFLLPTAFAPVILMALVGVVATSVAFTQRRDWTGTAFLVMAFVAALAFAFMPASRLWNARVLPFWFLALCMVAGSAIIELGRGIDILRQRRAMGRPVAEPMLARLTVPLAALVLVPVLWTTPAYRGLLVQPDKVSDSATLSDFVHHQLAGYEGGPRAAAVRDVINLAKQVGRKSGCGRVLWEWNEGKEAFRETSVMMLLPYWTNGCMASMEGLFLESSATSPFVIVANSFAADNPIKLDEHLPTGQLDITKAIDKLRMLGVRYYMATSDRARAAAEGAGLRVLGTTPRKDNRVWSVYEIADVALAAPLPAKPVVVKGTTSRQGWERNALKWFAETTTDTPVIADSGPRDWPRTASAAPGSLPVTPTPGTEITHVRLRDDGMSFHVSKPGVPVLVRVSYFPNWKAHGAHGPWRAGPNFMVVVPTSTNVSLRYGHTRVELVGLLVTLAGLGALALLRGTLSVPERSAPVEPTRSPSRGRPQPAQRAGKGSAKSKKRRR
jgi:hypothetical protein